MRWSSWSMMVSSISEASSISTILFKFELILALYFQTLLIYYIEFLFKHPNSSTETVPQQSWSLQKLIAPSKNPWILTLTQHQEGIWSANANLPNKSKFLFSNIARRFFG